MLAKRLAIDASLLTADPGRVLLVQDTELSSPAPSRPGRRAASCPVSDLPDPAGRPRRVPRSLVRRPRYNQGPNCDGAIDAPGAQLPVHADTVADRNSTWSR